VPARITSPNHDDVRRAAARNNAHWCDTLCKIHGAAGEHHDAYWLQRGWVPPYVSNLVTLVGPEGRHAQLAAIRALIDADPHRVFGVKDAFHCLELTPLGFVVLFEASWIVRAPQREPPRDADERLEWSVVTTPAELEIWERTWRGLSANEAARESVRSFLPALLDEPGFHFLLGKRAAQSVATAALSCTEDVVGLSNVFSDAPGVGPLFPGCTRLAMQLYPELPLVGFERGDDLVAAERAGFERVGGLRVWHRAPV